MVACVTGGFFGVIFVFSSYLCGLYKQKKELTPPSLPPPKKKYRPRASQDNYILAGKRAITVYGLVRERRSGGKNFMIKMLKVSSILSREGSFNENNHNKRVSMGWWLSRLSAKILALLRLSVNFFQLWLTKKLKINFFCFEERNINKPVCFLYLQSKIKVLGPSRDKLKLFFLKKFNI